MLGNMELKRIQYEYYDLDNGRMPIFVHTSITVTQAGATDPMIEMFVILSKDQPLFTVGIETNELEEASVYPNPATNMLHVNLPETGETVELILTDALGRVVYTTKTDATLETIDVSSFNKGTYILKMSNTNHALTKSIIIN